MVRRLRWLGAVVLLSCSSGSPGHDLGDAAPIRGSDGGASDAGLSWDAGPGADAGNHPPPEWDEFDRGATPDASFAGCFDGIDNDENGAMDCEDASCQANVPACCVAVGSASCCVAGALEALPLASCTGAVSSCPTLLEWVEPFGAPGPRVQHDEGGAWLVPGGQAADSGVVLQRVLDPRADAVTLEARVAGPTTPHARGADVMAFGLVEADRSSSPSPVAAVLVSGNRAEVSLLVAGEIVQRWALTEGVATYVLTLRPGGAIVLSRDELELGRAELRLERAMRPIVYGRTYNPGPEDPPPVAMASLRVRRDRCDIPSALGAGAQILPPPDTTDPAWTSVRRVAAPSVLRWTEGGQPRELMALEIDGAIHLARRGAEGWELASTLEEPALRGVDEWARDGLTDPVLRWDGAALELWMTGYSGDAGTVARVRAEPGSETFAWSAVEVVFAPTDEVRSFAQPAPFAQSGGTYVVMRITEASSGRAALASYAVGATSGARVREPSSDLFAFDRDDVASPVVVSIGGTLRLYYAGRRGTRWSIGMLVSPDGWTWMAPAEPVVREASAAGFDALGARDPSISLDGETLELFYTGVDGSTVPRVGVVRGPAPPR